MRYDFNKLPLNFNRDYGIYYKKLKKNLIVAISYGIFADSVFFEKLSPRIKAICQEKKSLIIIDALSSRRLNENRYLKYFYDYERGLTLINDLKNSLNDDIRNQIFNEIVCFYRLYYDSIARDLEKNSVFSEEKEMKFSELLLNPDQRSL